jgi:hypothetical protein
MRILKFLCLMAVAGLLLFLGGCQKEEHLITKYENQPPREKYEYKPKFPVFYKNLSVNSFTNNGLTFAPAPELMQQFFNDMTFFHSDSYFTRQVVEAVREGNKPEFDYAVYTPSETNDVFIISIPWTKENKVTMVINYIYLIDRIMYELVFVQNIKNIIVNNPRDQKVIKNTFYNASKINQWDFMMFGTVDNLINDWVATASTDMINSGTSGDRCFIVHSHCYEVFYIVRDASGHPTNNVTYTNCIDYYSNNCNQGDGWDQFLDWGGGSGIFVLPGSGPSSTINTLDIELSLEFPGIDEDCLKLLTDNVKKYLLEANNPCDPHNFKIEIIQEFNRACEESKGNLPPDLLLMNVEMWEFSGKLNQFLDNLYGFGSIPDQTTPPLSANNRLCPNSIIIKPNDSDPKKNVAGITGLQVSLNNGNTILSFNKIWFNVDHTRDCGIPTENLISQAINNAIEIADQRFNLRKSSN